MILRLAFLIRGAEATIRNYFRESNLSMTGSWTVISVRQTRYSNAGS